MSLPTAFAAALLALVMLSQAAAAQTYPSRPIRMVTASAPGSGSDVIGRLLSVRLAENFGQQVVVDNRAGASGLIGAEVTARATPDGYTFWLATLTQLISTTIGVLAPLGTPQAIVARINREFAQTVNAPDMKERLLAAGAEPAMSSPEEFTAFLRRETGRLGKLLKDAGVGPTS